MTLNLIANGAEQTVIKEYLEQNASDILAEKINSGVIIEKDGKRLVNRKTLDGFMKYATEEARKQAEKGASSAFVRDFVVFGWAVHYFEEDSIIGILYNEDGSEYKAIKTVQKTEYKPKTLPEVTKPKEQTGQLTLFDLTAEENISYKVDTDTGEVVEEIPTEIPEKEAGVSPYADTELLKKIFILLDNKVEIVK